MTVIERENCLQIGSASIPYQIKQGRPNRIRISFQEADTLIIETGSGELATQDMSFLESKSRWILKTFRAKQTDLAQKNAFLENLETSVPLLGIDTPLEFFPARKRHLKLKPGEYLRLYGPKFLIQNHQKKLLYYALRNYADDYLPKRVAFWCEICKLEINRVRVKDVKSKWGSCSAQRNINLNWVLVLLPEKLIDYLIIHELMHLHEMNHSPKFWKLVEKYDPQYKTHRKQLNEKAWLVGILK